MRHILALTIIAAGLGSRVALGAAMAAPDALRAVQMESKKIFGNMRENLHIPAANLANSIGELMAMHDEPVELGGGATMIGGCRPHSCDEKAAAVIGPAGRGLQAVALRHFRCRSQLPERVPPVVQCDKQATLLVYLIRGSGGAAAPVDGAAPERTALLDQLKQWGARAGHAREDVRTLNPPAGAL